MYDMEPDKNILEVVIDTPYGTAIEDVEVPAGITEDQDSELFREALMLACADAWSDDPDHNASRYIEQAQIARQERGQA